MPVSTLPQPALSTGVAGTGPAFSAYSNSSQTISNGTQTKLTVNVEEWDTANCFSSSRFTPNVAGYYQVNATFRPLTSSGTMNAVLLSIYKNGSLYYRLYEQMQNSTPTGYNLPFMSTMVYLNGSSDYIEIYGYISGGGTLTADYSGSEYTTKFQAFLARTA